MPNQYSANTETLEEKLFSKVDKSPGLGPKGNCWEWTGCVRGRMVKSKGIGYGVFRYHGHTYSTHRASYEIAHGPIPEGMSVLHSCDNPRCVNPSHLRAGTNTENLDEMVSKGRNWQQLKTHCPQGHEYTPGNTLLKNGLRGCRKCNNISCMARYNRIKAERAKLGTLPEEVAAGPETEEAK